MTVYLEDLLTVAEAGDELRPYLGGRNPTHFLGDNRCCRTREPMIPYHKKKGRIFYSRAVLMAFVEKHLRPSTASSPAASVTRMETDDCPFVSWRGAPAPILEVGMFPPLVLSLDAAKELQAEIAAAVRGMEASALAT